MRVSGILHSPDCTISLMQAVSSLHRVAFACLVLGLDVTGVVVSYRVLEGVVRCRLKKNIRHL